MNARLYEILSEHLSDRKRELFEKVINDRSRYFTIVLEDIYQAQNISAILRSAEAFGMQDLHIIENKHSFQHHRRIAKGANDWLTMKRYNKEENNSQICLKALKDKGYQIVVTAFDKNAITLNQVDLTKKTAFVLGTELSGSSETAMKFADATMIVPMYGFTESLNVSVAAAIIIQDIANRIRELKLDWQLNAEEKLSLKIEWAKKSITWSHYLMEMIENGELK